MQQKIKEHISYCETIIEEGWKSWNKDLLNLYLKNVCKKSYPNLKFDQVIDDYFANHFDYLENNMTGVELFITLNNSINIYPCEIIDQYLIQAAFKDLSQLTHIEGRTESALTIIKSLAENIYLNYNVSIDWEQDDCKAEVERWQEEIENVSDWKNKEIFTLLYKTDLLDKTNWYKKKIFTQLANDNELSEVIDVENLYILDMATDIIRSRRKEIKKYMQLDDDAMQNFKYYDDYQKNKGLISEIMTKIQPSFAEINYFLFEKEARLRLQDDWTEEQKSTFTNNFIKAAKSDLQGLFHRLRYKEYLRDEERRQLKDEDYWAAKDKKLDANFLIFRYSNLHDFNEYFIRLESERLNHFVFEQYFDIQCDIAIKNGKTWDSVLKQMVNYLNDYPDIPLLLLNRIKKKFDTKKAEKDGLVLVSFEPILEPLPIIQKIVITKDNITAAKVLEAYKESTDRRVYTIENGQIKVSTWAVDKPEKWFLSYFDKSLASEATELFNRIKGASHTRTIEVTFIQELIAWIKESFGLEKNLVENMTINTWQELSNAQKNGQNVLQNPS